MTHGNIQRNHAIKADVHRVRVNNGKRGGSRFWCFTFSPMWGPLLTDEWAEPVDNTPLADEDHPFWPAFAKWLSGFQPRAPQVVSEGSRDES